MGTSSIVYVSVPDTTSTCANLGLPTLPSGYSYNCVTTANLKKSDGTGWVPVDFTQITFGAPLSNLPVDPVNTTTTGNYYTYTSGGSWILTALPESAKQKTALTTSPNIPNYPGVIGVGSDVSLSPLYSSTGLVGYWTFDEGSGTTAKDSSGLGNNGTWYGSSAHYTSGKVGSYAGKYNNDDYFTTPSFSLTSSDNTLTFSGWVYTTLNNYAATFLDDNAQSGTVGYIFIYRDNGDTLVFQYADGTYYRQVSSNGFLTGYDSQWFYLTIVADYNNKWVKFYRNGTLINTANSAYSMVYPSTNRIKYVGQYPATGQYHGYFDDLRLYTRALSAAEISALYNATR